MTGTDLKTKQSLENKVHQAAACLNSFWPLDSFIACNALKEFEKLPFEDAMRYSGQLFGSNGYLDLAEYRAMYESGRINPIDLWEAFQRLGNRKLVDSAEYEELSSALSWAELLDRLHNTELVSTINAELSKWCGSFLDRNQAQWSLERKSSLYALWKDLAVYDLAPALNACKKWKKRVEELPTESAQALACMLEKIGVPEEDTLAYLGRHFLQLPGWGSHLKWRDQQLETAGILTDYLAIRLFYELQLSQAAAEKIQTSQDKSWSRLRFERLRCLNDFAPDKTISAKPDYAEVWQEAYELNYRNQLLAKLSGKTAAENSKTEAKCQLVFCIDVRSEPMRRQLEKIGPYQTYGFAGFFGFSMRLKEFGSAHSLSLCPVLLSPVKKVSETSAAAQGKKLLRLQALAAALLQLRKKVKSSLAAAFGLVEGIGLWSALPLLGKTFFPELFANSSKVFSAWLGAKIKKELCSDDFSLEEKVALAGANLAAIGLKDNFASLVVLCGHKSESINNPYASALDCGACGGNSGGFSARLACDIFNDKQVRAELLKKGIEIPASTSFVAAEHNTSCDSLKFYEYEHLSQENLNLLCKLQLDLESCSFAVRAQRQKNLPQSVLESFNNPELRAADWAQIAPEWGLAGNASFIVAPRWLTAGVDLEARSFLHSYDYKNDDGFKILELIMTAPMVVAQWINSQYYLSSVDNKVFGSGSKVLHNVVGDFAVMQGKSSDLLLGLPLQSLMASDSRQHEPMRLLVLIRAPRKALEGVLCRHDSVAALVKNRWIRLVCLEPETEEFFQSEDVSSWKRIDLTRKSVSSSSSDLRMKAGH